ncbi:hypothetical protein PSAC2689_120147 [Paraburkholderia sacchari]
MKKWSIVELYFARMSPSLLRANVLTVKATQRKPIIGSGFDALAEVRPEAGRKGGLVIMARQFVWEYRSLDW